MGVDPPSARRVLYMKLSLQAQELMPVSGDPTHWPTYFELTELASYFILSQVKLLVGFVECPVSQELVKR